MPEIGYNFLVGNNKPIDGTNKEKYEKSKVDSNKERASGSKMKVLSDSKNLPSNIYPIKTKKSGVTGYFVQIKIDEALHYKRFNDKNKTPDEKLIDAKNYLDALQKNNII